MVSICGSVVSICGSVVSICGRADSISVPGFYVYLRPSECDSQNLKEHSDGDTVYPPPSCEFDHIDCSIEGFVKNFNSIFLSDKDVSPIISDSFLGGTHFYSLS